MLAGAVAANRVDRVAVLLYTDDVEVAHSQADRAARPAARPRARGHRRAPGRRRALASAPRGRVTRHAVRPARRTRSPPSGSSTGTWCTATGPSWPTPSSAPTRTTPSRWRWRRPASPTSCGARGDGAAAHRGTLAAAVHQVPADGRRDRGGRCRPAARARLARRRPVTSPGPRSPGLVGATTSSCGAGWSGAPRATCCPGACVVAGLRRVAARGRRPGLVRDRPLSGGGSRLLDGPLLAEFLTGAVPPSVWEPIREDDLPGLRDAAGRESGEQAIELS